MILLTTKTNVSKSLHVAIGVSETDFNKYIQEAQEFDLKELVCEDFYSDLIYKKDKPEWTKIINGGDYEHNGRKYTFSGIAKVLAYFTYARFILKSNISSNSHGFTIKTTPHSTPLPLEERRNFYHTYRKDANTIFEDVKKFIERNISDYPSWNCGNDCTPLPKRKFKSKVIQ